MMKILNNKSGFTLIEMAVVLVIIGLILGAVSIGKDMQRNAEYKKIKQKFIDQWASGYNAYYEKYGVVLGDEQIGPTFAVGGADTPANFYAIHDGDYSGVDLPPRICHYDGVNDENPTETDDTRTNNTAAFDLHAYFDKAGLRMPPGRSEGSEDRYTYLDTNGNPMEVQVCFQWNRPDTATNAGNVMVIYGLTPDLARMLDQMIDGKADACEGMFRQVGATGCSAGAPGAVWGSTNADAFGSAGGEETLDEQQVNVLTAHYKMNQ